jgi:hypothetical protein
LDIPAKKMGIRRGWIWQEKIKAEYPVCSKHYFWLKGKPIIEFVLFAIWWVNLFGMPYDLFFPIMLFVIWILGIVFDPVGIKVRKDFYTMNIRNDDYAREFAMLNGLSPIEE